MEPQCGGDPRARSNLVPRDPGNEVEHVGLASCKFVADENPSLSSCGNEQLVLFINSYLFQVTGS